MTRRPEDYRSILYLPRPAFVGRGGMSPHDRAAQFSPFAALSGFGEEIGESARYTEEELLPDEEERTRIGELLFRIRDETDVPVVLGYFLPDERKPGGRYFTTVCTLKRLDADDGTLLLSDGTSVPMDAVRFLELPEEREA